MAIYDHTTRLWKSQNKQLHKTGDHAMNDAKFQEMAKASNITTIIRCFASRKDTTVTNHWTSY
jgi:hypothetical protein